MTDVDRAISVTISNFLGFESDSDYEDECDEIVPKAEIEEEEEEKEEESEVYLPIEETVEEFFGADSDDDELIQTKDPLMAGVQTKFCSTPAQSQTSRFRRIISRMTRAMKRLICCCR